MKALEIYSAVSQSLLHDQYGSKDKLNEAVMRKRSKLISDPLPADAGSII